MFLTTKELSKRWSLSTRTVQNLPVEDLPRLDISRGKKRSTYRYRLEDVERFESDIRQDGSSK